MSSTHHTFLFASLDCQEALTARKIHIRRLYDIMKLCIQRNDFSRAKRAWAILARCKEVHWMTMWKTGLQLLGDDLHAEESVSTRLEYLRTMMRQHPNDRQHVFNELILRLISSGRHKEALDELELYLPSFPYQDNPVLHAYAGFICLYLAQPPPFIGRTSLSFNPILLHEAQSHFEHARELDPTNILIQAFLEKIPTFAQHRQGNNVDDHESDDNNMIIGDVNPKRKRLRT